MSPLEAEDKHNPAEWQNCEKDRSGLREATASGDGKAWMFSYKASPKQLCAVLRMNSAEKC